MPGIESGLKATFMDGVPEPKFAHLGPRGSYDTEPEELAGRNQAADEKLRAETDAKRNDAAGRIPTGLSMRELIVDFTD